ncbi:MAG: tetratricopeptide repeat protein [Chlorobi bacterium]|nr:tetratricopeptide repeat protein [Chlorobiota bacterium]
MGITEQLHIESNFKKASTFVSEGNLLAAIQIYKKLLHLKDAERVATIKLADIYDQLGKGKAAINLFYSYLDNNGTDEEVVRLVGFYMLRNSMFKEAFKFVDKFQHISDENMEYIRSLLYFHTNQFEIAHINFKNYLDKYSSSEFIPNVYLYLAKTHMVFNEYDDALASVKRSIEYSTQIPEAYKIEAEVYYQKEMYYHASESIRKAVKMDSTIIAWKHLQIRILLMLGELSKAGMNLEGVIDNTHKSAELLTLLGHSYLKQDKVESAKNYFEKALKINPEYSEAIDGLKLC